MDKRKQEAYRKKLYAKAEAMQAELDRIQAKINEKKADAEINYLGRLEDLKNKKKNLEEMLTRAENTASDTWDDIESSLENTWNSLKEGADELKKMLSKPEDVK